MNLNKLTDREQRVLLHFTEALTEQMNANQAKDEADEAAAFMAATETDELSLQQAEEQAKAHLAARRKGNHGRALRDVTEDHRSIRRQIGDFLTSRGGKL